MGSDQKRVLSEVGRWLRVGTLTLMTVAPAIGTLTAYLRRQADAASDQAESYAHAALSQQQERLQVVGSALTEVLTDLKRRPYSQELLKNGQELSSALVERGTELSHTLAERSGEISRQLAHKSGEVSHELKRRGQQATHELAEQDAKFWIAIGFGLGLAIAGITTFQLIRRRLQSSPEQEALIELSTDGLPQRVTSPTEAKGAAEQLDVAPTAAGAAPADAAFIGVASTKQYYPVETPLDQLAMPSGKAVDVIYFSSEVDAQKQGFSAATR